MHCFPFAAIKKEIKGEVRRYKKFISKILDKITFPEKVNQMVLMRGNAQLLVNRMPPNDMPDGEVDGQLWIFEGTCEMSTTIQRLYVKRVKKSSRMIPRVKKLLLMSPLSDCSFDICESVIHICIMYIRLSTSLKLWFFNKTLENGNKSFLKFWNQGFIKGASGNTD